MIAPPDGGGPVVLYSLRQVARLTGIRPDQLRRWHRSGLLPGRARADGRHGYTFPDLIAARAANRLLAQGVTTRQVREAVEAVRAWRPNAEHPLAGLRVYADNGRLVVRMDDALVDARSGQLVLDLPVDTLARKVRGRILVVDPKKADTEITAEEWVRRGLEAENDGLEPGIAERRYRRALERDPRHAGARVNLGNVLYAQGNLQAAAGEYRAALESAPSYTEAWYNLANTMDDLGHADAAVTAYEEALRLDASFADAHFNLALLWEKQGRRALARDHWARFLGLVPKGASAAIARRFLADEED